MVLCAPKQYNPYYKSKKSIDKNFLRGDLKVAIFDSVDFDNHEQVVYCSDDATGLKAIIAVAPLLSDFTRFMHLSRNNPSFTNEFFKKIGLGPLEVSMVLAVFCQKKLSAELVQK